MALNINPQAFGNKNPQKKNRSATPKEKLPRENYVIWDEDTKLKLAMETASRLNQNGKQFDIQLMMSTFRKVIREILPTEHQRKINSPKQVPWLEVYVATRLICPVETKVVTPKPVVENTPNHPIQELMLETLIKIHESIDKNQQDNKFKEIDERLKEQSKDIAYLIDIFEKMFNKMNRLANTLPVHPPDNQQKLQVVIANRFNQQQRAEIEKDAKTLGIPIEIRHEDGHRRLAHISYFDYLIIAHDIPKEWKDTAFHQVAEKSLYAPNRDKVIEALRLFVNKRKGV